MSALRDAMSHAALGWVKPELDETLRQARNEIEYFAEEPSDTSRMRFCAGYLHQVQGTLRMVELYAPAMVAEELELLAQAVQVGEVADRDEACAMLMRGTVLLPDYLERLQNGHRDIPIVLLPLLNEIRATRGQPGLNESVLFAFDPQAGVATEAELDHARGSLSGRNRELLDTVGNAVKEELLRVKDALDLHLRTGGDIAELQTQVKDLGSVADTLGMMGLGVARNVVVQQRDALARVVDGHVQMDEGVLLDIAGALLYVDASLDDQVASLGADFSENEDGSSSATSAEVRRTVDVLAQEAIANFGAAREHFVAFIETNWDHARLSNVPHLLGEVGGALRILELPQAADYLEGVRRYVDLELIGKQRVPSGRQLDTLADAMASLEYYLEALRERRPGREEILDITRNSLETLRYWPLPSGQPSELPVGADQPGDVVEPPPVAAAFAPLAAAPGVVAANDIAPTPSLEWANETVTEAPFAASVVHDTGAAATDTVFSFDPVAAEETVSGQAHVPFTVAPLDLSDDGAQAPGDWQLETTEQTAPIATSAFDPVSAEQDGTVAAELAQVSYTVDLSALEQDDIATPVVAEQAPLQIEQIDLPGDADQTEVPLTSSPRPKPTPPRADQHRRCVLAAAVAATSAAGTGQPVRRRRARAADSAGGRHRRVEPAARAAGGGQRVRTGRRIGRVPGPARRCRCAVRRESSAGAVDDQDHFLRCRRHPRRARHCANSAGAGTQRTRAGHCGRRHLWRLRRQRYRRRYPRRVPGRVRRRTGQSRAAVTGMACRPEQPRNHASDPPRLPHLEGQWSAGRRACAGRVQLEDREHAQPRARQLAAGQPGGRGDGATCV